MRHRGILNWRSRCRLSLLVTILIMGCGLGVSGQTLRDSADDGTVPPAESALPDAQTQSDSVDDGRVVHSATALGDVIFGNRNSLFILFSTEGMAQDNMFFGDANDRVFGTVTNISSRIAYQRQNQRTTLGLDYSFGSRIYSGNGGDGYNQFTHDGGFDLEYRITERLQFRLYDRIRVAPDFSRLFQRDLVLGVAPADALPNTSLVLPLNKWILNTTYTGFSYQLSPRSQLSFGGNYSLGRYDLATLQAQSRYGAGASYSYKLAERTTLNLSYVFNYFDLSRFQSPATFNGSITPSNKIRHHYAYIGISHQVTPSIAGFVNVGPNVIIGDSINLLTGLRLRPGVHASVNAGLVLSKSVTLDPKTFVSFGVNQDISDGSGLGVVTKTQIAYVSLGRLLTRKVNASISTGYGRNKFLNDFDSTGNEIVTNGIYVRPSFRISITERLNFHAEYNRIRQTSTGFLETIPGSLSWNGFLAGLSYNVPVLF